MSSFDIPKSYAYHKVFFVVLAPCRREGEFVDSEVVGRMEKGQIKLPRLKKIYSEDSWQKTLSTFDRARVAFRGFMPGLPNPSHRLSCSINFGLFRFYVRYVRRLIDMLLR
jgi:hypothetical protein